MSSRKSNKFVSVEAEEVAEAVSENIDTDTEELPVPEIIEQPQLVEELAIEVNAEQAETERLNRVNDLEKQIIQHQDSIKQLRSELKKLEGKAKREGPTKMESCLALYNENTGLSRKEYVQMFQDKCGLTLAGARTYIQLIISKNK
ncbi:MAG: hypothetical protein ABTQ25_00040 [Nitrosomonas ureae]